jgi:GLPGLI family protein
MKYKIIICLFCCLIGFSQKTSGIVTYAIADVNVPFKEGNSQNEYIKSIIETAKNQVFELTFNASSSSFTSVEVLKNENYNENLHTFAKIAYTTSNSYYSNLSAKELITKTEDNILVKSSSMVTGWTILKDTKKIDQYVCYKAEFIKKIIARNGKEKDIIITAWFAPSLPFSFGPKEFNGLPGLILELNQNYTTYLAKKIVLSDKELKIDFPKGTLITEEEYDEKTGN